MTATARAALFAALVASIAASAIAQPRPPPQAEAPGPASLLSPTGGVIDQGAT